MKERLVELMRAMNTDPELTYPRYNTDETCKGCQYEKDGSCDYAEREADYLLANNVLALPYKPFPVVESEDENNSDVFCPFCDTDLSGHYYGGDYEAPKIVTCFGCGTWLDGTKAITKEEATKLKEGAGNEHK